MNKNHLGRKKDLAAESWKLLGKLQSGLHSLDTSRLTACEILFHLDSISCVHTITIIISTYKRICVWPMGIYWGTPKNSANPSPSKYFISETKGPSFARQCAKIFTWTILLNSPKSPVGRHYYYYHHIICKWGNRNGVVNNFSKVI